MLGTVVAVMTTGGGSGLPLLTTVTTVGVISVIERLDVVITVSPVASG